LTAWVVVSQGLQLDEQLFGVPVVVVDTGRRGHEALPLVDHGEGHAVGPVSPARSRDEVAPYPAFAALSIRIARVVVELYEGHDDLCRCSGGCVEPEFGAVVVVESGESVEGGDAGAGQVGHCGQVDGEGAHSGGAGGADGSFELGDGGGVDGSVDTN